MQMVYAAVLFDRRKFTFQTICSIVVTAYPIVCD